MTIDGVQIPNFGQGSGMRGLPAEGSAPARFLRPVAGAAAPQMAAFAGGAAARTARIPSNSRNLIVGPRRPDGHRAAGRSLRRCPGPGGNLAWTCVGG